MADFKLDLRDIKFVLFEQLGLQDLLGQEPYADFARDDLEMILDEAAKLATEVMAPANAAGDREGCKLVDGQVHVPEAYRKPYQLYCEAQWLGLNHEPEWGGQGAPRLMRAAVDDMFFAANIGLNLGSLLTAGAARLIVSFASDELKQRFLPKMYSGEWGGTMCLTEPQAGSDVGASRTKATPEGDHYLIEGEKIFITYGDHDLTDNIVHCVLARIDGAPKGTRGLSLFAVPKVQVNPDGSLGESNNVVCTNVEHKLGIHGSPTCALSFGSAGPTRGWLIGGEHQGMRLMFQLMNEARLGVGLQGVALSSAAYQAALSYASERLQGAELSQLKNADAPRVPILDHPDVRMMLMRQKAYSEGCRALLYFAVFCEDAALCAATDDEREKAQGLVEVLTPVCKAYASDMGFRAIELAVQTLGGYGYLRDYPVEQYLRDCKIASIYEGTNGIQAMDLVLRKLPARNGADLMYLLGRINELVNGNREHPVLATQVAALGEAVAAWTEVNALLVRQAMSKNVTVVLAAATEYLGLCGDIVVAFLLLQQAVLANERLAAICADAGVDATDAAAVAKLARQHAEARFYDGKVKVARFFCANELPRAHARAAAIRSGDTSAIDLVFVGED